MDRVMTSRILEDITVSILVWNARGVGSNLAVGALYCVWLFDVLCGWIYIYKYAACRYATVSTTLLLNVNHLKDLQFQGMIVAVCTVLLDKVRIHYLLYFG